VFSKNSHSAENKMYLFIRSFKNNIIFNTVLALTLRWQQTIAPNPYFQPVVKGLVTAQVNSRRPVTAQTRVIKYGICDDIVALGHDVMRALRFSD
jgi:hypothetical protein